ncbi:MULTISPECIES: cytochrome c oxidase assembly protein [unclassified Oceanobacillus]|uniref:cytochrome c oxidase assembly protein n=1 Tax=unclassified Oceanobacillus TaxID=2630292 RepID=UPI00300E0886
MLEIILDEFHYSTLWNGGILIYIGFIFIIYFLLLPQNKKYPVWKQIMFVAGMIAVFAALGSPINVIARIKYSYHIIQLVLLVLVAPPLIIIGFKIEIFEHAKKINILDKTLNFLAKPIVGFLSFFILFYTYHIASVFNFARLDLYINYFFMLALLIAGILLWMPIVSQRFLNTKKKQLYILFCILFFIPYSLVLLLSDKSLYLVYTDVELFMQSLTVCMPNIKELPPEFAAALLPFNPEEEQMQGGVMLLISQLILFGIAFFAASITRKEKIHI